VTLLDTLGNRFLTKLVRHLDDCPADIVGPVTCTDPVDE